MCGIAGFIDHSSGSSDDVLHRMADCLLHRGPDDSGYQFTQHENYSLGLGFRRLSIIDLSPSGHQPMKFEEAGLTIIFNGEIYNYREIKKELEKEGYTFRSGSDTEVILKSYHKWGTDCIHKFTGMFAMALHDEKKKQIILIRDRAGVKPLFYYWNGNTFLFSSELKAFHLHPAFKKELNTGALALYFQHGYVPAPHCIFKNAFKLMQGHYLVFDLGKKIFTIEKYWDAADAYNKPKLKISFEEAASETEKLMQLAFEYRMVADVPVGVFLSGGYDSTCVTALLQKNSSQKIKTFTIGFHEAEFNEAEYAKKVAAHLGTGHHEYYCSYKEAMDIIPKLPEMYDEPFADSSAIPTYLVSKMARQQVTVALSADGGDELFAGYSPKYEKALRYVNMLGKYPAALRRISASLISLFHQGKNLSAPDRTDKLIRLLRSENYVEAFDIITQAMTETEVKQLLSAHTHSHTQTSPFSLERGLRGEALDNFLCHDYKTYMADDILQKVDRATMAVSLEGREPLIDHRLLEFVAQLPSGYKLKNGRTKILLKDIVHRYVPKEMMERGKMGFQVPVHKWMKAEQKEILTSNLNDTELNKHGLFNNNEVKKLVNDYFTKEIEDFHRVWKLLMFQMWWNRWN